MRETLAPVRCVVQEKNANLDVNIIRRDRAILYRVQPRKVMTVRKESLKWKHVPVPQVEELITVVLDQNDKQSSSKVIYVMSKHVCLFVVKSNFCELMYASSDMLSFFGGLRLREDH